MNEDDRAAQLGSNNETGTQTQALDKLSQAKTEQKLAYKDGLFRLLFNEREAFVELYNAISGEGYLPESAEIIEHIEGFKPKIRHDLAYVLGNKLIVMMEHQSTRNDYLPLRMLRYFTAISYKFYKSALLYRARVAEPLANVEFYVVYNGRDPLPKVLKLSEIMSAPCYHEDGTPHLECAIGVIDLGRDSQIRPRVKGLEAYCFLVKKIETLVREGRTPSEAIRIAIECAEKKELIDPNLKNKLLEAEMELFEQYDEEEIRKVLREEALEEGIEKGIEKGREEGRRSAITNIARQLLLDGINAQRICEITGLSLDEVSTLD